MIADLLRGRFTAADLHTIDAEVARLVALRELIAQAVGAEIPTAAAPEQPAGKSPPAAPKSAPRAKQKPGPKSTASAEERRLKIARALAGGPLGVGELAERTGIGSSVSYYLQSSDWFRKANGADRLSPWTLTATGRAALEARATTPTPNPVPTST